jgi:hypothetical protein
LGWGYECTWEGMHVSESVSFPGDYHVWPDNHLSSLILRVFHYSRVNCERKNKYRRNTNFYIDICMNVSISVLLKELE